MPSWESSHVTFSKDEKGISKIINMVLGNKYKGIGEDLATNLNLYRFLINNLETPDSVLAQEIKDNGKPVFTEKEIAELKIKLRRHVQDYKYALKILDKKQKGGNPEQQQQQQQQQQEQPPQQQQVAQIDASRNGFWDRLFVKLGNMLAPMTGPMDKFLWVFFILYSLEQTEIIGPFISQGLDLLTLSLPVFAEIAEEIGTFFIPIPVVGAMGGWVIGLFFLITSVFLNFSRKHFGSAFKSAVEMLPVIGDSAGMAVINIEQGMERFLAYKNKLVKSTSKVSPQIGSVVQNYYPQLENVPAPEEKPVPTQLTGEYWEKQAKVAQNQAEKGFQQLKEGAQNTFEKAKEGAENIQERYENYQKEQNPPPEPPKQEYRQYNKPPPPEDEGKPRVPKQEQEQEQEKQRGGKHEESRQEPQSSNMPHQFPLPRPNPPHTQKKPQPPPPPPKKKYNGRLIPQNAGKTKKVRVYRRKSRRNNK